MSDTFQQRGAPPAPGEADKALARRAAESAIARLLKAEEVKRGVLDLRVPVQREGFKIWLEDAMKGIAAQARKEGAQGAWEKAGESVRQSSIRSEKYPHRYVSAATFKTRVECALEREAKGGDPR